MDEPADRSSDPGPPIAADRDPIALERIVCGLDGSPQGLTAARQAVEIAAAEAQFWAVASWDASLAFHAGIHMGRVADDLRGTRDKALATAGEQLPELEPHPMQGGAVACLLAAMTELEADLVSVGSHGGSRAAGFAFGSVATAICRHAPSTVLVAREPSDAQRPCVVIAGDGSAAALEAARLGAVVAGRLGAVVTVISADQDRQVAAANAEQALGLPEMASVQVDVEVAAADSAHRRITDLAVARDARLVVVGSRGLGGLKALGSTSERVAHEVPCSVLIVRRAVYPSRD